MIEAALKTLSQMVSPPFRTVLLKSVGLALFFLALIGIALNRLLAWLTGAGEQWVEHAAGPLAHGPLVVLGWLLAIALGLGIIAGVIFLMPAVTALVASFFADEIAETVERVYYPADPVGVPLSFARAALQGVKTSLFAILIYLCAMPFLLLAGFGAVIFFVATAYLLGREYFELAAMRFHSVTEARALRRKYRLTVFVGGLFIAAFVSIPIINLATPLFGTALMVHVHKRLAGGPRRELIDPPRNA